MKQEQVEIKSVNVYTHIFWKDNLMKINQQTLHAILNRLLKYYAVKFHVNRDLSNERYTSTLKLNDFPRQGVEKSVIQYGVLLCTGRR